MADAGMKMSLPGVDVRTANKGQLSLSSGSPMLKLDTQSKTSFVTVLLLFNNDPPEGVTGTVVYTQAHGLTYTPRVWSLFQVQTPPIGAAFYQAYFQDSGEIGSHTAFDGVTMYATADSTNVYIKLDKFNSGGSPNNLIGTLIQFTIFTFVDDLTGV